MSKRSSPIKDGKDGKKQKYLVESSRPDKTVDFFLEEFKEDKDVTKFSVFVDEKIKALNYLRNGDEDEEDEDDEDDEEDEEDDEEDDDDDVKYEKIKLLNKLLASHERILALFERVL